MWIILKDKDGIKQYVNAENIVRFHYEAFQTKVYMSNGDEITARDDITAKLVDIFRLSGAAIKQIGE